jgi:NADPH:quinone reductase-like Zn-dependent oxidoreductase
MSQKRGFRPEEVELAQALANQAMMAIQLTRLSAQSRQSAVMAERNRIACDIHDTLAQGFTGVSGEPLTGRELDVLALLARGKGNKEISANVNISETTVKAHLRTHWAWAIPLAEKLNFADAGPLLCGGVTVFAPLTMYVKPTDRVGIIGIGGLGHMAVKFAAAYGCDVTAFTSSANKFEEAKGFGAHHVVSSKDSAAIKKLGGSFDLLISTVNAKLDWDAMIGTLAPNGRLHVVGAVLEPIPVAAFSLIMGQRSVSGSPSGSPVAIEAMLDFASRHNVAPQTEHFPMSKINEAFARLDSGKARYRIVLDADF